MLLDELIDIFLVDDLVVRHGTLNHLFLLNVPLEYVADVFFVFTSSNAKAHQNPVLPHLHIVLVSTAIIEAAVNIEVASRLLFILILVALLLSVLVDGRARLELVLEVFLRVVLFKLLAF